MTDEEFDKVLSDGYLYTCAEVYKRILGTEESDSKQV